MLKFGVWLWNNLPCPYTTIGLYSARARVLISFHTWKSTGCVMLQYGLLYPLTMLYTQAISRGYLHVHKCSCTSFQANLLASARSSPKRRLIGYSSINFTSVNHGLLYTSFDILLTSRVLCLTGLSYLCQRPQWVIPNGKHSGWTPLLPGVPEGNILGPLLFACYVADLNNIKTGCLSYADVKIFHRIREHADTISL